MLFQVTATRVTRRSTEQKKDELMEQDVSKQMEDVEMADLAAAPVVKAYSVGYV